MSWQTHKRQIVRSVILATCQCGGDRVMNRIDINRIVDRVMLYIGNIPPLFRWVFGVALFLVEYWALFFRWKFSRFTKLPINDQLDFLSDWHSSSIYLKRTLSKLVLMVSVTCVYSEEGLLSDIGFTPHMAARREHPVRPDIAEIERSAFGSQS